MPTSPRLGPPRPAGPGPLPPGPGDGRCWLRVRRKICFKGNPIAGSGHPVAAQAQPGQAPPNQPSVARAHDGFLAKVATLLVIQGSGQTHSMGRTSPVISAPSVARPPRCAGPRRPQAPGSARRPGPGCGQCGAGRCCAEGPQPVAAQVVAANQHSNPKGLSASACDHSGWSQSPRARNAGRAQSLRRTRPAEHFHSDLRLHRHGEVIHDRIARQAGGKPCPLSRPPPGEPRRA